MEEFLHIMSVWLHVLGIALWVGPQVFLAFAWVPASRNMSDLRTRVDAMRTITRRFGYIGGIGLALIIIAGTYLISTWRDYYEIPDDVEFTSLRWGVIFIIKMSVLLVMLALAALHVFVVGPRQIDAYESKLAGDPGADERIASLRKQSMATSILILLLTLAIMVMGSSMGATGYSFQEA